MKSRNPEVATLDCLPGRDERTRASSRSRLGRRTWVWGIDASLYGAPESRSRAAIVCARVKNANADNMGPQYVFGTKLPVVAGEFERRAGSFVARSFIISPRNFPRASQPTPLGWLAIPTENLLMGLKPNMVLSFPNRNTR